jgi:hypothetical protein
VRGKVYGFKARAIELNINLSTIPREATKQRKYKRGVASLDDLKKKVKKEWDQVMKNQNLT